MAGSGIYEIVNLVNGKRYVGSALKFTQRWCSHRHRLRQHRHHSPHLQASWDKYGEEAFAFRVIERCDREVLLQREQFHIDQGCDYNVSRVAGSPLGVKHSKEARERMSMARRGKAKSESHIVEMAKGAEQQWRNPEVRAKMSAAIKENWAKRKAEGYKHPPLTDEQRKKQSAGVRASYTPELRAKRSADNRTRWAKAKSASS